MGTSETEICEGCPETRFKHLPPQLALKLSLVRLTSRHFKGAVGSADLKISKSALLSLNHHNFLNTKPIYTE